MCVICCIYGYKVQLINDYFFIPCFVFQCWGLEINRKSSASMCICNTSFCVQACTYTSIYAYEINLCGINNFTFPKGVTCISLCIICSRYREIQRGCERMCWEIWIDWGGFPLNTNNFFFLFKSSLTFGNINFWIIIEINHGIELLSSYLSASSTCIRSLTIYIYIYICK